MEKLISSVGVDSGIIMISDRDYYNKYNGKVDKIARSISLKPGSYNVKWKILETWNGPIEGEGTVELTSGKMIISDPCYNINNEWDKWLKETDYGKNCGYGVILIDKMGGDGTYEVLLNITSK